MSTSFSRSIGSLGVDRFRGTAVVLLVAGSLLAVWLGWFLLARVTIYEFSPSARLEIDRAVHPIDSPVAGRVVANRVVLDREVRAGDLLVELDVEAEKLELEEQQRSVAALTPQLEALRDEILVQQQSLSASGSASRAAVEEARAKLREAQVAAKLAEQEVERLTRLDEEGLLAEVDLDRATARAAGQRAVVESRQRSLARLTSEQGVATGDRRARLEQLRREQARIEGEIATAKASARRLENAIARRSLFAPARGRVVEAAELEAGAFVEAGDRLGVILGEGALKAVATYSPSAALGRIKPRQPARLRLEGFPSAQYGSLEATVTVVSSELRDGRVRVELALDPDTNSALPLQHGLPGSTEIEIERVTPATLVLRAAGKLVSNPPDSER